jgi:hypothetical protein
MQAFTRLFTAHPAHVNESYFEHMRFAGKFAVMLFAAAFCALVHAILPFLFEKTAGNLITRMHGMIHNR